MKKIVFAIIVYFAMVLIPFSISAVPAKSGPRVVSLPDGTTLTVLMFGDERKHYVTTEDGYFIWQNEEGFFVYAIEKNDGTWHLTPIRAHDINQRTVEEKDFLNMDVIEKQKTRSN